MTIAIFGATGHLGGLVIDHLIARGADPGDILALGRNEERLAGLAARGLRTARVDLADPAELPAALAGVQKVLLISASDPGARVAQHRAVIDAAAEAGVGHLAYTSILQAPTSPLGLAVDHRATEDLIAASGIPATFLRNGWYTENYAGTSPWRERPGSSSTASETDGSRPHRAVTTPKRPRWCSLSPDTKGPPTNFPATPRGTTPSSPRPPRRCSARRCATRPSPPSRSASTCSP